MAEFPKKLILATKNLHKIREFELLFSSLSQNIELFSLKDPLFGKNFDINWEESSTSYSKNAEIKAKSVASFYNLPALADDSGIEIEALSEEGNKLPGPISSRWGGKTLTQSQRNTMIIEKLRGLPISKRQAKFICYLALAIPKIKGVEIHQAKGEVRGYITEVSKGENGFGYDPIFFYPPLGKTFGELSIEEKNKVSHRAQAVFELLRNFKEKIKKAR